MDPTIVKNPRPGAKDQGNHPRPNPTQTQQKPASRQVSQWEHPQQARSTTPKPSKITRQPSIEWKPRDQKWSEKTMQLFRMETSSGMNTTNPKNRNSRNSKRNAGRTSGIETEKKRTRKS